MKMKMKIENNLVVLPSHDIISQMVTYLFVIMDSRAQRVLEAKFRW